MKKYPDVKYEIILLLLSAVIFYSCTASSTSNNSNPGITFQEIKAKVNNNSMKLTSLDAEGEISIDSPNLSNTGSITASINKPDSIFIKLEGPFGIDLANLLITRNDFVYYNVQDNRVIKGPSNQKNLGLIMRVKLEFDDILNSFSGRFSFNDENYNDINVTSEEDNYIVTLSLGNEIRKYWVDKDNFYVTRLKTMDSNGGTIIEIIYEDFYEKDDIYFPKKISINRPKEKQNIWLTYYKEKFNNNKLTYKIKIPKSAKLVNWQ